MTYGFRQDGIRDRLAVGDHAIEVEDQRAHPMPLCASNSRVLYVAPKSKWTRATEAAGHFLLRFVSTANVLAMEQAPIASIAGPRAVRAAKPRAAHR